MTFDLLKARHPHPITETREALEAGQEKLAGFTSEAGARTTAAVTHTRVAAKKTRKVVKR